MKKIEIKEEKYKPYMLLDPEGKIVIKGKSYPENSFSFYEVLFDWLEEFTKECRELEVNLNLEYFNSTTSQVLFEFFDILEEYNKKCPGKLKIYWWYDKDNDSAKEAGEDFKEDFENLNIEVKEI